MLRISNIKAPIELPVSILMQNLPREIGYRGRFKSCNIVKKALDGVKVLGNGELSKKLTVQVNAYSESAKQKIEAAGGKAEVI